MLIYFFFFAYTVSLFVHDEHSSPKALVLVACFGLARMLIWSITGGQHHFGAQNEDADNQGAH